MWPFKKREPQPDIVPLFRGVNEMLDAMKQKDPELREAVGMLSADRAWRAWKDVYHEDFPDGGMSIPGAHCIMPRQQ